MPTSPALPPSLLSTAHPTNLHEAALVETALREAARTLAVTHPGVAVRLSTYATRVVRNAMATHGRRLAARQARGRWAHRPYKAGPLARPGIAHVTVFGDSWSVDEHRHQTLCGRILTGRTIEFGPRADVETSPPHGWGPSCERCTALLADLHATPDPKAHRYDTAATITHGAAS